MAECAKFGSDECWERAVTMIRSKDLQPLNVPILAMATRGSLVGARRPAAVAPARLCADTGVVNLTHYINYSNLEEPKSRAAWSTAFLRQGFSPRI